MYLFRSSYTFFPICNSFFVPNAVSWVDGDGEIKEAPIPEQFMHRLVNGSVTSQVSDLYH
jgi:hypothetical protein